MFLRTHDIHNALVHDLNARRPRGKRAGRGVTNEPPSIRIKGFGKAACASSALTAYLFYLTMLDRDANKNGGRMSTWYFQLSRCIGQRGYWKVNFVWHFEGPLFIKGVKLVMIKEFGMGWLVIACEDFKNKCRCVWKKTLSNKTYWNYV